MKPIDRKTRLIRAGSVLLGIAFIAFILGMIPAMSSVGGSSPIFAVLGISLAIILVLSLIGGGVLIVMGLTSKAQTASEIKIDDEIPPASKPEETPMLIPCPSCGTQNPADNKFCEQCGTSLL